MAPKSATELMWEAVEEDLRLKGGEREDEHVFPNKFLSALRVALESGMSAEQITAALVLLAGLHEVMDEMDGEELLDRCEGVVKVMREDIDRVKKRKEYEKGLPAKVVKTKARIQARKARERKGK